MFRRSRHIAIRVEPGQVEEAVAHYKALFGLHEESRIDGSVELVGSNFTISVDLSYGETGVLQEWVTNEPEAARRAVLASGATIVGDSLFGFYVRDGYGLHYHVFVEDEPEA
jgi:hypothetical protein